LSLATNASARTIDSTLRLKAFQLGGEGQPDRLLGAMPSKNHQGIRVPLGSDWYVTPVGAYTAEQWSKLAEEVTRLKIPGLYLSGRWDFTDVDLRAFANAKPLKRLRLEQTRLSDSSLASLANLPALEEISVGRGVGDAGVQHLAKLQRLKTLDLSDSRCTDKAVQLLVSLPSLENLNLSGTRLTDAGIVKLPGIHRLKILDISGTAVTDQGIVRLATLPALKTVYLPAGISDVGFRKLLPLRNLEILDLSGGKLSTLGVALLAQFNQLRELALTGNPVGNEVLPVLSRLPHLKTLEISETTITPEGIAAVGGFPMLETVGVSAQELTQPQLELLVQLPKLKQVVLAGWSVPEAAIHKIRLMAKAHRRVTAKTVEQARIPIVAPVERRSLAPRPELPKLQDRQRVALKESEMKARLGNDIAASPASRPTIPLVPNEPTGLGMIIEVPAGRSGAGGSQRRAAVGLKRIRQIELGEAPRDLALSPGASPKITSIEDDPSRSLGEIEAR
jgi:hypothetical protein